MRSGNILQEIWLNKDNVDKAYKLVNRKDIKEMCNILLNYLEKYQFNQKWIEQYRKDMICYLKEKHKINTLFPFQFAKDILNVLKEIDNGEDSLKRVLSMKCFGYSKYFEKNIEHFIIRIIKIYLLDIENQEEYNNDDVLMEVGISKYPEILEFCGDLEYFINGEKVEYKRQTVGSYVNSYCVKQMQDLKVKNANKVIFIENKANYIDYIHNKKKDDEFVLYHGGMYSPIKGDFYRKIYMAISNVTSNIQFYHWSDIDIGGFEIFTRLMDIIPELKQYKMDTEAFNSKKDCWKEMSEDYILKLIEMRNSEKYGIFYDVIDEMLKNGCRLEQEAFIY